MNFSSIETDGKEYALVAASMEWKNEEWKNEHDSCVPGIVCDRAHLSSRNVASLLWFSKLQYLKKMTGIIFVVHWNSWLAVIICWLCGHWRLALAANLFACPSATHSLSLACGWLVPLNLNQSLSLDGAGRGNFFDFCSAKQIHQTNGWFFVEEN